jgi:phospholipase C
MHSWTFSRSGTPFPASRQEPPHRRRPFPVLAYTGSMINQVLDHLNGNEALKAQTVLIITFDEGGGYYDSGYIQPIDFFGDGPRIPLIVVPPFTTGCHISHAYADHASILKFIERNWHLTPLTGRSRDNFPNPIASGDPYVPSNSPAISDLFDNVRFWPS